MSTDVEDVDSMEDSWEDLAADWRAEDKGSEALIAPDIRRNVRRQSWRLIATLISEIVLTVAMMGYFIQQTWGDPTAASITLTLATALVFAVLWVFSLWNRKGIWRPTAESTLDFVEFSRLRAERKLQAIHWIPYFVVFELMLMLPPAVWMVYSDPERWARFQETYLIRFGVIGLALLGTGIFLWWRRGRILKEMEELEILRRELGED